MFPLEGGKPSINMINKKELIQMSEFFRERESEFTPLRHYLPGLWTMGKKGITEISSLGAFSLFPFLLSSFFFKAKLFSFKGNFTTPN